MMFVFDIETIPDPSCIALLPEPDAPGNYKSEDAIAKYKAEARAKQIGRMALDPALCRIAAIGYGLDGEPSIMLCPDEALETQALQCFWAVWDDRVAHLDIPACFNGVAFDLPVLMTRSRILGVKHPNISLRKYGSPEVLDLMLDLSFNGLVDYKSLSFWVKRFRLDVPDDPTSGKDIGALVATGDWDAVADHCRIDILKTHALATYLTR